MGLAIQAGWNVQWEPFNLSTPLQEYKPAQLSNHIRHQESANEPIATHWAEPPGNLQKATWST